MLRIIAGALLALVLAVPVPAAAQIPAGGYVADSIAGDSTRWEFFDWRLEDPEQLLLNCTYLHIEQAADTLGWGRWAMSTARPEEGSSRDMRYSTIAGVFVLDADTIQLGGPSSFKRHYELRGDTLEITGRSYEQLPDTLITRRAFYRWIRTDEPPWWNGYRLPHGPWARLYEDGIRSVRGDVANVPVCFVERGNEP